ncbi:MAG: MazG nucleotide pyrophosphohydrolase domain-containing protein, partial [Nitriliruptoraceae bacterium]
MPEPTRRILLVETADTLPGLLPFHAWDVVGTADTVYVRDASAHPSAPHLHAAGLDLTAVEPAQLERADLDLSRPGSADDRRIAKALLAYGDDTVYLMGPDDRGLAAALAGFAVDTDVEIELVFFAPQPAGTELLRAVDVMAQLRDPEHGCPWDLQQDHASLVEYLVEETYELVDAIEQGDEAD